MKQIITLHVGQAGVQSGQACWDLFCQQHGINMQGQKIQKLRMLEQPQISPKNCQEDLSVLFDQTRSGHYVPRTNFFDMDPTTIDELKKGKQKNLLNMNHVLSGKYSANTFAEGFFAKGNYDGATLIDRQLDQIRKMIEKTDSFEGFVLSHSVSGGTGSGFGSLLLQRLSMDYPKKIKISFTLYPSNKFSSSIIQPYQAVLATHSLLQYTDACIILDNQTLYNVCQRNLGIQNPSFANVNHLIAQNFSCLTSFNRFPSSLGMNFKGLIVNSIPYQRIHFLNSSLYPYAHPQRQHLFRFMNTQEITKKVFQKQNFMQSVNIQSGKYISSILIYRGNASHKHAMESLNKIENIQSTIRFVDWVPRGHKIGICQKPLFSSNIFNCMEQSYYKKDLSFKSVSDNSVFMLGNHTSVCEKFSRIDYKFDLLYSKRAFVHWYIGYNMEQAHFSEARQDLAALQKDYEEGQYQQWNQDNQQQEQIWGQNGG